MRKLNIDKKLILFSGIVLFVLIELAVLMPLSMGKLVKLNKETKKIITDLDTIEKEWPKKDEYRLRKEQLKEEIKRVNDKFVLTKQESKLLSFISSSSKNFSVEIMAITPNKLKNFESSEHGNFQYLPIDIQAKGRFHNIALFLDFLQNSQYFFECDKFKITQEYSYDTIDITLSALIQGE